MKICHFLQFSVQKQCFPRKNQKFLYSVQKLKILHATKNQGLAIIYIANLVASVLSGLFLSLLLHQASTATRFLIKTFFCHYLINFFVVWLLWYTSAQLPLPYHFITFFMVQVCPLLFNLMLIM